MLFASYGDENPPERVVHLHAESHCCPAVIVWRLLLRLFALRQQLLPCMPGKLPCGYMVESRCYKKRSQACFVLQVLYEEEVRRLTDTFEQQFHYGVFYSYMRLREQEIRNLMWISECVAQDQKARIMDGIVFLF